MKTHRTLNKHQRKMLRLLRGYKRRFKTTWVAEDCVRRHIPLLYFTESIRSFYRTYSDATFAKRYPKLWSELLKIGFEFERPSETKALLPLAKKSQ